MKEVNTLDRTLCLKWQDNNLYRLKVGNLALGLRHAF